MRYLPIEYLLIFLPIVLGIIIVNTKAAFDKVKPKIALWIGWHIYHEDWRVINENHS